jgi:two-component system chemotaxis response regulator CheY
MAKIVVIDDEKSMADMVTQALIAEGHHIFTGYDGQMGMQLAMQHRPQLIISDVNMPLIHGGKLLEFLRRSPELKEVPLIFLSGAPANTVYPLIDNASRVAFLKKPIEVMDLLSLVNHFLEKYPLPDASQ